MTAASLATAELAVWISRGAPSLSNYSAAHLAHRIERLERAARRHAERACSDPRYDEAAQERAKRRLQSDADRIRAFNVGDAMPLRGWVIEFHGDPRGSCLTIARSDAEFRV